MDTLRKAQFNHHAFESLAVSEDTKELVQAVVVHKIEAEKTTDLVAGKGVGLILLLHGCD